VTDPIPLECCFNQRMAAKLIEECLKLPALRRDIRVEEAAFDPKARERRERDELRSNELRTSHVQQRQGRQERGELAQRDELERSITELKRQIKLETKNIEMRKLLLRRIKQSQMKETPLSRAAIAERDQLALLVIELHRKLSEVEAEEELVKDAQSRSMQRMSEAAEHEQDRKRRRVDTERVAAMKSERAALRRLFFTLIMESGVDWLSDDVLAQIVWSLR